MFPDTHSTPTETRVLMRSIHLRWSSTLLYCLALLIIGLTGLYSQFQMSRLGLLPAASAGDFPALLSFTTPYEPLEPQIPVTGMAVETIVQQTFVDDFSFDTRDWSALEGEVSIRDGSLRLSPDWLGDGGTAVWNLPADLVGASFTFAADLSTRVPAWQRFGLALNLGSDGSGLLLLIEPDNGKAAVAWRYSRGVTYLVPWQRTPGVLPAPMVNHVEVVCTSDLIILRVNGLEAVSLPPPLPCNQGALGVLVLNPTLPVSVDNASLELHTP